MAGRAESCVGERLRAPVLRIGHIQRRPGDRRRARYVGPDGREQNRTFGRKIDAERFLATVEVDKLRGEWVDPRRGKQTFEAWALEFEASRVGLQRTTLAQHAVALRTHIVPRFGNRALASITPMDVRSFVADLVAEGMAPSYVTKHLRILLWCLASLRADLQAQRRRPRPHSPFRRARPPARLPGCRQATTKSAGGV